LHRRRRHRGRRGKTQRKYPMSSFEVRVLCRRACHQWMMGCLDDALSCSVGFRLGITAWHMSIWIATRRRRQRVEPTRWHLYSQIIDNRWMWSVKTVFVCLYCVVSMCLTNTSRRTSKSSPCSLAAKLTQTTGRQTSSTNHQFNT
jgi:hypothetical protein